MAKSTLPFLQLLALVVVLLLCACNALKNQTDRVDVKGLLKKMQPESDSLARSAGANAALGASEQAQLISQKLLQGLKGSMDTLDPDIQKIMRTVEQLGSLSAEQLDKMGQKLDAQVAKLKTDLKDEELKQFLVGTVESLTGTLRQSTRTMLSDMVQTTLDSMGSASTQVKIERIIDQLLGESTQQKAQKLVQGALQPTMDTLLARIDKIVHKDVPFVQRQANKLLILLALLSAGIIGFVWYQRRRYARLVGLLTFQIDKLTSKDAYDELTGKIRNEAQKSGLEPLLRETLKEQGINT
jgi:hypothetical protein